MKKRLITAALFSLIAAISGGCHAETKAVTMSEITEETQISFFPPEDAEYISALDISGELPPKGMLGEIAYEIDDGNEYNSDYITSGYYISRSEQDNSCSYIICSGEKHSGGFDISIVNIELDKENNLYITVKQSSPEPYDVTTQAFTYPYCTVTFSPEPQNVFVRNTNGFEFSLLE